MSPWPRPSSAYRLRRPFLEERLEPRLGLVVALGNAGHQRLGEIAGRAVLLRNAWQHMGDGEIGHRRVRGDALGELDALVQAGMERHHVMREAEMLAFLGVVDVPSEHHLHHTRRADQPRQPYRAAAADEDAAASFRQRVVGRGLRHAHVARGGELEPAAHHRTVHHRDDGHLAELDALERAVPTAGVGDALGDIALGQLAEVEAGTEMIALAVEHHRPDPVRQGGEERLEPEHGRVVEGIALVGARERQDGDGAAALGLERVGERHVESVGGRRGAHGNPRGQILLVFGGISGPWGQALARLPII